MTYNYKSGFECDSRHNSVHLTFMFIFPYINPMWGRGTMTAPVLQMRKLRLEEYVACLRSHSESQARKKFNPCLRF